MSGYGVELVHVVQILGEPGGPWVEWPAVCGASGFATGPGFANPREESQAKLRKDMPLEFRKERWCGRCLRELKP